MSRELPLFRIELEQIMAAFPDKAVLNRTDIMRYTGRGRCWLDSHGFSGQEFTRADVANTLAGLRNQKWRRRAS